MKKGFIYIALIIFASIVSCTITSVCAKNDDNIVIQNKNFSIELPKEVDGTYEAQIDKHTISIYDKSSKEAGFGGFAFGIRLYKNPKDHATLPGSKKIGELKSKMGTLYDVVLEQPTDVQFDYTKGPKASKSYARLYELGDITDIKGIKGAKFYKDGGTKGEDLYKAVLEKHIKEIKANSNSMQLEKKNMSYMYNVLAQNNDNVLDKVGYAYYDANGDGIDELLIGEIATGNWKGVIYDIYTMVNRKPKHVVSGGNRNRYYVCDDVFICNEYSSGAEESGVRVYALVENSTELYPQVSFKYDGYTNKNKPWFISYSCPAEDIRWENVDKKTYMERKSIFSKYVRFDFTPLSKY